MNYYINQLTDAHLSHYNFSGAICTISIANICPKALFYDRMENQKRTNA